MRIEPPRAQRRTVNVKAAQRLTAVQPICAAIDHLKIPSLQEDLFPDRSLVKERPFATQLDITSDKFAKFGLRDAKDKDVLARWRAKRPPAVVLTTQSPTHCGAGWHVRIIAATNVNDTVPRFLATGRWDPNPTIATITNAMDISLPNNFPRVR